MNIITNFKYTIILFLIVLHSQCLFNKTTRRFNAVINRDTNYIPHFFPPYHQPSGHDISDYWGITADCLNCISFKNYKVLSYEVFFQTKEKNEPIGIFLNDMFSKKLRRKIAQNREKYYSIEFKNIIIQTDNGKLINIGSLSTYMKHPMVQGVH